MVWFVCDDCGDSIKKVMLLTLFCDKLVRDPFVAVSAHCSRTAVWRCPGSLNWLMSLAAEGASALTAVFGVPLHLPGLQSQL